MHWGCTNFVKLLEELAKDATARFCDKRNISAQEQLAVFLHFAHRGLFGEDLQERFKRGTGTIKEVGSMLFVGSYLIS